MSSVGILPGTRTLTITTPSYYRDGHFDSCESAGAHLVAPVREGQERRDCRIALGEVIPEEARGKKGRWVITARFEEEKA